MKKYFPLIFLFFIHPVFAVIESVPEDHSFWSNTYGVGVNTFRDAASACDSVILFLAPNNFSVSSIDINPLFPDVATCLFKGFSTALNVPASASKPVFRTHVCPMPPNLPNFVFNQASQSCERENPCPVTSVIGIPRPSTGWGLGTYTVGLTKSTCGLGNCLELVTPTASVLGITTFSVEPLSNSCFPEGPPLPPIPMKVSINPITPSTSPPVDQPAFDKLAADKVAADLAAAAAAAAASAASTAAAAAQAAADKASADAYIASVIARANAIKAGLPIINLPQSPTTSPVSGGGTTGGGTTGGGTTGGGTTGGGTTGGGTTGGGTTGGGTTDLGTTGGGATTSTASCATFSICNVEQYLQDIKNALGFGQSFDATAAAADAKVATMEKDGQTALKKVGDDAATQEAADESLIKSAFQIPALRTTCTPIIKIVMGRPLSIDLCFYTEIIRQIIAFLFGLFGAFTVYQIAFRKN